MTQDEIIEMYMQVSKELCDDNEWCWAGVGEPLQMFAKLVAAKATAVEREACTEAAIKAAEKAIDVAIALEREACAEVCEEAGTVEQWDGLSEAADRIRARGEA